MIVESLDMKLCVSNYCFMYPIVLLLIIPFGLFLIWIIRKNFIKFRNEKEGEDYRNRIKLLRSFMIFSRILIMLALILAMASPFTMKEIEVDGDHTLKILVDNSTSFDLFDKGIGLELKEKLEKDIPVSIVSIGKGKKSNIGDTILNNIQGDDNILVISDGNNNEGRLLGDVLLFSSSLNASISTLDIKPIKNDVGVRIEGPTEVIAGTENEFFVVISKAGNVEYTLEILVDGQKIMEKKNSESTSFKKAFSDGYHEIEARLTAKDYFSENNVFYKTVKGIEKPEIVYVYNDYAELSEILKENYGVEVRAGLPKDTVTRPAIIMDNINADSLTNEDMDMLTNYVAEKGNGLVVIGGDKSYDKGNYKLKPKSNPFETLLPVKIGTGSPGGEGDINVVVVIDISDSADRVSFEGSTESIIDVAKAIALRVIEDMDDEVYVSVVAFDAAGHLIIPLMKKSELGSQIERVKRLTAGAGTIIYQGLSLADNQLSKTKGSLNMILISDGQDAGGFGPMDMGLTRYVESLAKIGYHIYTVGLGTAINTELMEGMAQTGNGVYFEPNELNYLKIIFGEKESDDPGSFEETTSLFVADKNHFITKNLGIKASVTGINFVVDKPSARPLVITKEGSPILSVWRFGLGRIVALTTDDGMKWAGELYNKENSKIITRMINWAIGDISRTKEFDVKIKDTTLGEHTNVQVISKAKPTDKDLEFSQIGPNFYSAEFIPTKTGFSEFLGAKVAVNYNKEYIDIGMNPEFKEFVKLSGGSLFEPDDIEGIVTKVRTVSKRKRIEVVFYRWIFVSAAIILLLIEITIRKIKENRRLK